MRRFLFAMLMMLPATRASGVVVSDAASLKDALTEVAKNFETDTAQHVDFEFAASGQIVARILQGAKVDVFISAAPRRIDELESAISLAVIALYNRWGLARRAD